MLRGRHRASFDHDLNFNRGRITAYRDYGLSFRKISQPVGRNQATAMWICHRWTHKETMDQQGQSHPLRFTAFRVYRRIAHMPLMNYAAALRAIA
ncbi:hypothetical protein TNCV_166601 [Trichonephila clavipes]|nr:hypothetical protein TNCV_166601 [Trichonephila clavipes]